MLVSRGATWSMEERMEGGHYRQVSCVGLRPCLVIVVEYVFEEITLCCCVALSGSAVALKLMDGWMDGLLSRALPYREMPRNGQNFHSIAQIALFEVIAVHQHSYNCDLAMLEVKYITTYSSTGNERGMGLVGLEGLEHTG